jgi:hypothetical protein
VKLAAQRDFRAALLRIRRNAAHLEQWQAGALAPNSREYLIGEALDFLARTGDLPGFQIPSRTGRSSAATARPWAAAVTK